MSADWGADDLDVAEELFRATMEVSKAHIAMSGLTELVPNGVQEHHGQALALLEQAIVRLRGVSIAIGAEDPDDRPE